MCALDPVDKISLMREFSVITESGTVLAETMSG